MYLRLSKKGFAFFDKRIAVCRAHDLYALAYKSHTCSLIGIFCQVQEVNCPEGARETTLGCAPTENDQNPFAACGRQTLRGFFDTLKGRLSALFLKAIPRNSARSLRQDFCPNSKLGKRRNTVCISGFSN